MKAVKIFAAFEIALVALALLTIPTDPSHGGEGEAAIEGEAAREGEAPAEPSTPGPVIMGVELSDAPWVSHPKDLPDLYQPSVDQPGSWQARNDVFSMPLVQEGQISAWLKYSVSLRRFYIEYRSNRDDPTTERTYGPFEADPFEEFDLEEQMAAKLQDGYAPDVIYRIKLMLRTGDAKLAERALRLMRAALSDEGELYEMQLHLPSFQDIMAEHGDGIAKHGLRNQLVQLQREIDAIHQRIDKLTVSIPDQEYSTPKNVAREIPAKIPDLAWGEPVNGLRAAAVPDMVSVTFGEPIRFELVVENVSAHVIKFAASDLLQGARIEVKDTQNRPFETRSVWFSGIAPIERYLLKPGERIVLTQPSITFIEKAEDLSEAPGMAVSVVPPETYLISYRFGLGVNTSWHRGDDGVMRRVVPAQGEWVGTLSTGMHPVSVEPTAADPP